MSNEALLKQDRDLSCPYYSIYFAENPPGTIENGLKKLKSMPMDSGLLKLGELFRYIIEIHRKYILASIDYHTTLFGLFYSKLSMYAIMN